MTLASANLRSVAARELKSGNGLIAAILVDAAVEIERLNDEVLRLMVIRPQVIEQEAEALSLVPKAK